MDHEEDKFKFEAILQFIGRFPTLSGSPPLKIKDLDDGVALFEILSEIAPEYLYTAHMPTVVKPPKAARDGFFKWHSSLK
jgi:hypothetical protein